MDVWESQRHLHPEYQNNGANGRRLLEVRGLAFPLTIPFFRSFYPH